MIENINWYPGQMVDVVIEVIDARIPISSRNPIINDLIGGKQRVIVLNKVDLADNRQNERWTRFFKEEGHFVVPMNCMNGSGVSSLLSLLSKYQDTKNEEWSRKRTLRMMIVGVPNVGKSSLINRLLGKKSAKTGDRPGVTRGKQWLTLSNGMQLLDTPGILWPKFEDPLVGLNLAFCGSIRDETMDLASLALELVGVLQQEYPEELMERYKLIELGEMPLDTMEAIALKRGFILSGKRTDYERTARTLLDEFRAGIIGRITLEHCEE